MELFFKFQAMERNGDVVAELKNYSPSNCTLLRNSFSTGKYKMCKDDIVTPLFCSASDRLGNGIIMDSQDRTPERYKSSDESKIGLNFFSARRNCVSNEKHTMPIIQSTDTLVNNCDSPTRETPPKLQIFSPSSQKAVEKLYVQDSFINGSKVHLTEKKSPVTENRPVMSVQNCLESTLNNTDCVNDKLLLDYEAETSSSSIEEVYPSAEKNSESSEMTPTVHHITDSEFDDSSNLNSKSVLKQTENASSISSPTFPRFSDLDSKSNLNSPPKNDRIMPELIPTLICLDDDDPVTEKKQEQCEVIDVASSPEMPILIPFTSEVDETFRVKTEVLSDSEKSRQVDSDSRDSTDGIRQPHVLLKRLPINHSGLSEEEKENSFFSAYAQSYNGMSRIEGPEIEEIEGVRFFQFRSKQEMEEFNRKPETIELDLDMIVPTKTTDITQIKGWRNKYFAPESQFHHSFNFDVMKTDDSSQDSKVSVDHTEEAPNKNDDNDKKESHSNDSNSESKNQSPSDKGDGKQPNDKESKPQDGDDDKIDIKCIKKEKDKSTNLMSAFVSEELDRYLLNSSSLNVSLLEKVNPNIIPIPRDASILSIGKLRKTDTPTPGANMIFKRKREFIPVEEKIEVNSPDSVVTLGDSPESPSIITLGSTEPSSSEEDIPVAKLRSRRRISARKRNLANKNLKRKNLDNDLDQASKRVVLRLTKEGDGVSKGYKVSDISCNNENVESSSSSSEMSLDAVVMPEDGSLPIIKHTLFTKKNEPNLLDEFLNNLNMYGTRKDVAMLVQSNQSYFDEGPVLTSQSCIKAISVLVSNKIFIDLKQKSKKKKLKTWQKYLPKKLTDIQKMKIKFPKRKTRVQLLLDEAANIAAERGKRSIRLPARYLDSAVLAAGSEWVSPVITLDDSVKTRKRKSSEILDKIKTEDQSKCNESIVLSDSSSSSESSSSENSESESDESISADIPVEKPTKIKQIPAKKTKKLNNNVQKMKRPLREPGSKNTVSSTKEDTEFHMLSSNKNTVQTVKEVNPRKNKLSTDKKINVSDSPTISSKDDSVPNINESSDSSIMNVSDNKGNEVFPSTKVYFLPNCYGHRHCSRTSVFDYKAKKLYCLYSSHKNSKATPKAHKDNKKVEVSNTAKNIENVSKSNMKCINIHSTSENSAEISIKPENVAIVSDEQKYSDSVSCDNFKKSTESLSVKVENQQNKVQLSLSPSSLQVTNSVPSNNNDLRSLRQKNPLTGGENASNIPINVPSNNVSNKFILLITPVKSVGNVTNTPQVSALPILPKINLDKTELLSDKVQNQSQKIKPSILIHKSPQAVSPNLTNDSLNYVSVLDPAKSPSNRNYVSSPLSSCNGLDASAAALKLSKLAESNSLSISHVTSAPATNANHGKNSTQNFSISKNTVSLGSSSLQSVNSQKVITAYKVGDNYFFCNSNAVMQPSETKSSSAVPSIVSTQNTIGPIISSVQSNAPVINTERGKKYIQVIHPSLHNGLTKRTVIESNSNIVLKSSSASAPSTPTSFASASTSTPISALTPPVATHTSAITTDSVFNEHHNYHKKNPAHRRKSPLSPKNYIDDESICLINKNISNVEEEIDVETVDTSFHAFEEMRRKGEESDASVSDSECASIFASSADHLASMYSKKSIKERKRRLLIKTGFENLKASSKSFKNAKSCVEILEMAQYVIDAAKKKEKILILAKKRLKIHNTMLLEKLVQTVQGIEPPDVRNKIKSQIIKDLALDRKSYKEKKPFVSFPYLFKPCKERAFRNSNIQRKNSSTDVPIPNIEFSGEGNKSTPPKKRLRLHPSLENSSNSKEESSAENSHSLLKTQSGEALTPENSSSLPGIKSEELRKLLESPSLSVSNVDCTVTTAKSSTDCGVSPKSSGKLKIAEMKQKVIDSLRRNKKENETSGSDTEDLDASEDSDSESSDSDGIEICEDEKKLPEKSSKSEIVKKSSKSEILTSTPHSILEKPDILDITPADKNNNKTSDQNYPGLIPILDPKVYKENFSTPRSSRPSVTPGESSLRTKASLIQSLKESSTNSAVTDAQHYSNSRLQESENLDCDVSIIGSKIVNPILANAQHTSRNNGDTSEKSDVELTKAAQTANKLFGPCTVQKVQLKNGKTVFAYKPEAANVGSVSGADSDKLGRHPSSRGVRNLDDVLRTIKTSNTCSNQNKQSVPEEIVISDSDDETQEVQNVSRTLPEQPSSSRVSNSGAQGHLQTDDSDSNDGQLHIDESDLQNIEDSSL